MLFFSARRGRLCVGGLLSVSSARAEYYSWVDENGVLHLTNIARQQSKRPNKSRDKSDHFGGIAPLVVKVDGGKSENSTE